jgi:hypothetical protein
LRWGLANFLPRLTLNHDPPALSAFLVARIRGLSQPLCPASSWSWIEKHFFGGTGICT